MSRGNVADRRVEQLDAVANRQLSSRAREGRLELQQAAGVAGHNHVRVQRGDVARFPVAELRRSFRLHQVVDSRGAAADRGFGDFQQLELRDAPQQSAQLRTFSRAACPNQCSASGRCLDAGCLLRFSEWPRDFPRNGRTTSWDILREEAKKMVTIDEIQTKVAEHFDVR